MARRFSRVSGVTMAFAVLAFGGAARADVMYAGNGNRALNPGGLSLVDQTNGSGTLIGDPVTPGALSGIAFDSGGTLYGSVVGISFGASSLVTIDPDTGSLLSSVPVLLNGTTPVGIADLAIQPGTNTIYGSEQGIASDLYTIAPDGTATLVGNVGLPGFSGLAFAPDGTLFGTNATAGTGRLVTLNPLTAAVLTSIVTSGFQPEIDGLAVRPSDGTIFGTRPGFFGGDFILTVDPTTGVVTGVGPTGVGSPSDLAFRQVVIPEPTSLAIWSLVGLGGGAYGWRRKRRRRAATG